MDASPGERGVPVLGARAGGPAERFARRLGGRHPVTVFVAALLLGFAAIAGLSIGLGLLVTDVLVHVAGIGSADERFVHTLADHRTAFETDVSSVGSMMGGAPVLPIIAALVAIGAAIARHWRIVAFAIFVLAVESATYRVTTLFIHRDRPHVHRLEALPADASFPSGHTAASIAVYAGLVLLLTSRIRDRTTQFVAWALAVVIPIFVAMSRMYRGMHHPLDVAGGVVIGVAAIVILLFACRAASAAAQRSAVVKPHRRATAPERTQAA